jgi:hypothetical protein
LIGDARLSAADRLGAVAARVDIAKLDAPNGALPDALLASVREQVARGDKETADPYAREVVINEAAYVLAEAGLFEDPTRCSPPSSRARARRITTCSGLAANAKKRGDKAAAVAWTEKAYGAASGPATRLQWGVSYVNTLIDLAPDDPARIERAAIQVIDELEPDPDTFYDRNRRSLEKMAKKLLAWNKGNAHAEALRHIRAQLAGVCSRLPACDPPGLRATAFGIRRRPGAPSGSSLEQGPREQCEWGCDRRRVDARGRQRNFGSPEIDAEAIAARGWEPRAPISHRRFNRRRKHGRRAHCAHDQRLDTTADRDPRRAAAHRPEVPPAFSPRRRTQPRNRGLRHFLQARADVDGVAQRGEHHVLVIADIADDHLAAVDADAELDGFG